jgi:parvulin-like peptidyl-prolyl isomerase
MKSFLKIFGWLIAATAITASAATDSTAPGAAATPSLDELLPDTTVAKGKGFEIKRSKLDQAVISYKSRAAAQGQEISPEQMPMLERQALDDLILVKLLNGAATADQKSRAEDEAGTNYATLKKQFPTEELMVRQFKTSGLTPEQVRSNLVEQATAHIVLTSKVKVTDDDVKKFYDDNPTQMEEPARVRLNFIVMGGPDAVTGAPLANDQLAAKKKQIEDLRDRARKGEDFVKLVRQYSEDTRSKERGGEITLGRNTPGVPPELDSAAFALETNQVSDVITTQYGLYLLKLAEKIPAKKATLAEAGPEIRKYLEASAIKKMLPAYYTELKKDAGVEILDPKLKEMGEPQSAGGSGAVDMIPPVPPTK